MTLDKKRRVDFILYLDRRTVVRPAHGDGCPPRERRRVDIGDERES